MKNMKNGRLATGVLTVAIVAVAAPVYLRFRHGIPAA